MDQVIHTENLGKVYSGATRALDNLNLDVQRGEIFGYLGPNGAGKTTTIRLLLDLIRPTTGSASLLGLDARRDSIAIKHRVGYLPAELNLWDRQTAQQIVQFVGQARGDYDAAYVHRLAERLEFDLSKKVRSYSTGNKRKLGLIIALMNKPDLLILDEPSSGLDPLMQQTFYQLMQEARNEGRTVFLSSHILSEVQAICDRVAILRDGQLQAVRRVAELTHNDFRHMRLRFREPVEASAIASVPGVSEIISEGKALSFQLVGDVDPLLRAISSYYVEDIEVQEPTLEEVFLKFYSAQPNGVEPQKVQVKQ
ncbi:MAG: ATP-binding cassette domain-containing protein [Chloroflexi bacterium]|nr:ATP-binding cassette domain-containing protein [Chloroflexota bacterium]